MWAVHTVAMACWGRPGPHVPSQLVDADDDRLIRVLLPPA